MTDYSKTIIYKIVCKDPTITSFYIGSTTNFTKRKYCHKICCNNENNKKYNFQIYQTIRNNGGFENWSMILIEDFPCENKREAEKREQYWKDELKPDMNKKNPFKIEFNIKVNPIEYYKEHYQKELLKNPNINKDQYQKRLLKNSNHCKEHYQKVLLKNPEFCKEQYEKRLLKNPEYNKEHYQKYNYKVTCDCGSIITHCHLSSHKKSLKHKSYELSLINN